LNPEERDVSIILEMPIPGKAIFPLREKLKRPHFPGA